MDVVLFRAKPVLVLVIVMAILYVFISPLPEMAATNSVRSLVFVISLLAALLAVVLVPVLPSLSRQQVVVGSGLSRSLLCSRLC